MILSAMMLAATTAMAAPGGLDVYSDGKTIHRLEAPGGANVVLSYRRSDDGGKSWTKAVAVDPRIAYRFGAGDARVASDGDRVYALWTRPGKGPYGSGPLAVAVSTDGGKTWAPGASPAGAGSVGRRFPALAVSGGVVHAFWLDRATNAKLLASYSADGAKTWSKPAVVDDDVCECCWNSALAAQGTVYVLYRDRNPRDMGMALTKDGGKTWTKPEREGRFGWGFEGCPHVGGALASVNGKFSALVWTGKSGKAGLYVIGDGERRVGGPDAKHADMASNGAKLGIVWDEDGKIVAMDGDKRKVLAPSGDHPRIVAVKDGFRAFWNDKDGVKDAAF